jgi:hypothetical protein
MLALFTERFVENLKIVVDLPPSFPILHEPLP